MRKVIAHRCRFVEYSPSAITAIAFPPPVLSFPGKPRRPASNSREFGTLVVGRANGNIELCEWSGGEHDSTALRGWVLLKTLSGPSRSKADSLVFVLRNPDALQHGDVPPLSELRLFSAGAGSEIAEWDLTRGTVTRSLPSQGGNIWVISANAMSTRLAAGCEDGSINVFDVEFGQFVYLRRLDRAKTRILSLAWGPPVHHRLSKNNSSDSDSDLAEEDTWKDQWLVGGCADSSIRKWDLSTGRVSERLTTDQARGEKTLVWAVATLRDGTLISGDSLGMVKFWDAQTATQIASFQAHGADVLCLAIGSDGSTVFSSGVDQRIAQFSLVNVSSGQSGGKHWIRAGLRRLHSHDVRALAIWPPYSTHHPPKRTRFCPVLVSGGLDMCATLTPCGTSTSQSDDIFNPLGTSEHKSFEDSHHRRMTYPTGSSPALCLARQARLVCCMHDSSISVWRIRERVTMVPNADGGLNDNQEGWDKVLDLELRPDTNLMSAAISGDGQWLSASDMYETRLFRLSSASADGTLKPKRLKTIKEVLRRALPDDSGTGSSSITFTPDSLTLILATAVSANVLVISLPSEGRELAVTRVFHQHQSKSHFWRPPKEGDDVEMNGTADAADSDDEICSQPTRITPGGDERTPAILRLSISPDGQWLASTDESCRTHIFNLDSLRHHCALPAFQHPVQALAFNESGSPAILVMTLSDNSIHVFDAELRQFPEWTRGLNEALPRRFTRMHDPVLGITFNPALPEEDMGVKGSSSSTGRSAVLWGSTWIANVVLASSVHAEGVSKKRRHTHSGAREREKEIAAEREDIDSRANVITKYRHILLAGFLGPDEMLVVERPLTDVLSSLPPAYFRTKYGS